MTDKIGTEQEKTADGVKQLSSLELIWKLGFDELDAWAERYNKLDELFLEAVKSYVENIKRNQENIKEITERFGQELKAWEKSAREELLVTTTTFQQFFPVKSYQELNDVVNDIQKKTTSLLLTPFQSVNSAQALDKYLETVEKYIAVRKAGREKYIDSVKKTTNVLYENQKIFVDLFSKQVKSALFPLQKYMKNATEPTKS
jgi:flagellar hook-basal body complex protein FliE